MRSGHYLGGAVRQDGSPPGDGRSRRARGALRPSLSSRPGAREPCVPRPASGWVRSTRGWRSISTAACPRNMPLLRHRQGRVFAPCGCCTMERRAGLRAPVGHRQQHARVHMAVERQVPWWGARALEVQHHPGGRLATSVQAPCTPPLRGHLLSDGCQGRTAARGPACMV